jgi:WD40 repeat protein
LIEVWRLTEFGCNWHAPLCMVHGGATDIRFSPDDDCLAVVGSESDRASIGIWDVSDQKLIRRIPGHANGTVEAAFVHGKRRLITCGDRTIRFWNIESGEPVRTVECRDGQ